jgi:hypothetical protein
MAAVGLRTFEAFRGFPETLRGSPVGFQLGHNTSTPVYSPVAYR